MKKKKLLIQTIGISIVFVVIILLCFCFIPIQSKIDMEIAGIQCRNNDQNEYFEEKRITIKGTYNHYLFKTGDDYFNGQFSIDGYTFTYDNSSSFYINSKNKLTNSIYYTNFNAIENGDDIFIHFFGIISCKQNLERFLICIYDPIDSTSNNWNSENGLIICAPASNRKEAIEIAQNEMNTFNWK